MRVLPVRKWLNNQTEQRIELSREDFERLGRENVKKIILIGAKYGKDVKVITQDTNDFLTGAGKPWTRNTFKSLDEMILYSAGFQL
ncbi:hypothetical protein [Psychrobacillus sp. FSL H8-0510]|uniref:hypothetical protein n=1 Tax=Psychrobacillus sp. FSL H8-0510 TaxID=2921394 RepID=UPI0030F9CBCA